MRIGNFNHHSFKQVLHQLFEREASKRGEAVSGGEVEREHLAAMASLTSMHRRAVHHINRALQIANFNHHSIKEILLKLFEKEAIEHVRRRWALELNGRQIGALKGCAPLPDESR